MKLLTAPTTFRKHVFSSAGRAKTEKKEIRTPSKSFALYHNIMVLPVYAHVLEGNPAEPDRGPSRVASVCTPRGRNGWTCWRKKGGRPARLCPPACARLPAYTPLCPPACLVYKYKTGLREKGGRPTLWMRLRRSGPRRQRRRCWPVTAHGYLRKEARNCSFSVLGFWDKYTMASAGTLYHGMSPGFPIDYQDLRLQER